LPVEAPRPAEAPQPVKVGANAPQLEIGHDRQCAPIRDSAVRPVVVIEPEEVGPGAPAERLTAVFGQIDVTPIDLATALRMVDVQNPQFLLAQARVLEAVAARQLAAAQFLPTINVGTSYDGHTGNLQQSDGNILSVKRNSLTVGAGVNAVAAGSVNIPGLVWNQNLSVVLFDYLRSRQVVDERRFATTATRNDIGLQVVQAYLDLLEAEGRRSIELEAYGNAATLFQLTDAYARTGQGREADAHRARSEQLDREALVVTAEGDAVSVSARLAQLLSVDPAVRLHPVDNWVVPHCLVPDPIPLGQLLAIALMRRPELGERQAAIRAAMLALDASRMLPFSPTVFLGFSGDDFGGGSNLVAQPVGTGPFGRDEPRFGAFSTRTDFDAMAYWTLRNIGLGNRAQIGAAASRLRQADWERLGVLENIRLEVANAWARVEFRFRQIQTGEQAVAAARDSWVEDVTRIRGNEGLPIEAVNSLRLLARAQLAYLDAIVEYNRAQFALYVALGEPPADALVREVPMGERLPPRSLPLESLPPIKLPPEPDLPPLPLPQVENQDL
jgi:outer membrane protein TolC